MILKSAFVGLALLVSVSAPSLAAGATPERAGAVKHSLESYFGKVNGFITVTPANDAYDLKVDLAPVITRLKMQNGKIDVSPMVMKLVDQGGGKWLVTQDTPMRVSVQMPNVLMLEMTMGSLKSTGVFDEALATYSRSSTEVTDLHIDETVYNTTGPTAGQPLHVTYDLKSFRQETTSTVTAPGVADFAIKGTGAEAKETFNTPPSASMPSFVIQAQGMALTQDFTLKGLHSRAIADLLKFIVAHVTEPKIGKYQGELKTLMSAALPVFESLGGTSGIEQLTIGTPMGAVTAARASVDATLNGVVEKGQLRETVKVADLVLPAGLVPSFAAGLVPKSFALDFQVRDYNLAAAAKLALEKVDFDADPPTSPEVVQQLLQKLLPGGTVTFSTSPSSLSADAYTISIDGSLAAGPTTTNPQGQAVVTATGVDKVIDILKAAPPEMGWGQGVGVLVVAKGLAKTGGDGSLSWKIETTPNGSATVNGIDITKIGKP